LLPVSRRSFLAASAAVLGLSGLARASTGFIRKPYLQRLLADKASILWTTAEAGTGSVLVIGPDGAAQSFTATATAFDPSVTALPATFYQYQADITGLHPGIDYQYRISMDGELLSADPFQNAFRTPAAGSSSFLVFGDSGCSSPEQIALSQSMLAEPNISKVIHVGDIAYYAGSFAQFEDSYFAQYASLMSRVPFFPTPGNHEYLTDNAAAYLAVHAPPASGVDPQDVGHYYSFDWGDAHFVSIDSNRLSDPAADRMLAWLDADLAATRKYWKIAFLHHPAYPTGAHLGDPLCALAMQNVNPILERRGVQLVLAGHEHGYARSFPLTGNEKADPSLPSTTYLITGGGGAGLVKMGPLPQCAVVLSAFNYLRVDVEETALTFTATGLDGAAIDRVTLTPPPAVAANGIVNGGDFSAAIAPGSVVSIFGQNFAIRGNAFSALPLPTELSGVSVTANGIPAPLFYVSPGQINIQLPYEVSGQVELRITTPNGSATGIVNVTTVAPSILAVVSGSHLVSSSNPAIPGSYLTVYATGLGKPTGFCPTGQATSGAMPVAAPVQVEFGGTTVQPAYAGLAPLFAGLNQVNVEVPRGLAPGIYPLRLATSGALSGSVSVQVAVAGN